LDFVKFCWGDDVYRTAAKTHPAPMLRWATLSSAAPEREAGNFITWFAHFLL
jgi:hypothetical protein